MYLFALLKEYLAMSDIQMLEISPNFAIEDIRKLREWDHERNSKA
jgi:hypothetical protein